MEKRIIELPNGNKLHFDVTPVYLNLVRQYFNLSDSEHVTDEHLRMFLFQTTKSAVDKAESNL